MIRSTIPSFYDSEESEERCSSDVCPDHSVGSLRRATTLRRVSRPVSRESEESDYSPTCVPTIQSAWTVGSLRSAALRRVSLGLSCCSLGKVIVLVFVWPGDSSCLDQARSVSQPIEDGLGIREHLNLYIEDGLSVSEHVQCSWSGIPGIKVPL